MGYMIVGFICYLLGFGSAALLAAAERSDQGDDEEQVAEAKIWK